MNNGDYTYVGGPTLTQSCIDLSMVSTSMALDCSWRVEQDNWRSDHYPISIELGVSACWVPSNRFRYNLKKMNWSTFYQYWNYQSSNFTSLEFLNARVQERYSFVVKHIIESIESAMPFRKRHNSSSTRINNTKKKPEMAIWWNDTCEKAIRIKKAKWLSLQYKCTREEFLAFKKIEAQTKVILKEERKKAFHEFCESLNRNSSTKYVFDKIKCFKNKFSKPSSCEGNKKFIDSMNKGIEELCSPGMKGCMPHLGINHLKPQDPFLDSPFDFDELIQVLNKVKKSAPGCDKINYEIILALPDFMKRVLLDIYNDVIQTSEFPNEWKDYLCFFIPKENGATKLDPLVSRRVF